MATVDLPLQLSGLPGSPQKSVLGKSLDSSMFRGAAASSRINTPQTLKSTDNAQSSATLEKRLRAAVRSKARDILAAFKSYDIDGSGNVTKGELRRVLELFCFSLTTEQFDSLAAKIATNANGTVRYSDFLKEVGEVRVEEPVAEEGGQSVRSGSISVTPSVQVNAAANVDVVEKTIRERVGGNVRSIVKAMQLFDYNRDRKIQRHELRTVIENYCGLKLTDSQFDKLWSRYDFHRAGAIDYVEFLQKIGVSNVPSRASNSRPASALSVQSEPLAGQLPSVRSLRRPMTMDGHKTLPAALGNGESRLPMVPEDDENSLAELERVFRGRFKSQLGAVRKAFAAFDTQRDGFIELDDLKAVLREFVLPTLTDWQFAELMRRAGLKANGRVGWRNVLGKFEHPLSDKLNGQTLPIRNDSHHYNPVMGGSESVDLERLLALLHDQVRSGYGSFKQAFLQIDYNRDGKISRSELRKVLERFKIRFSDEQFSQLLIALGMHGSQTISYHRFLEIFEPKDTEEHKWLTSVHRYNDSQKPLNLAWRTVEELLCTRLSNNWKEVARALARADAQNSRQIEAGELRSILQKYAFPVSDEHFGALLARCGDAGHKDGKCNYDVFFERLGVDVRPSDVSGVSAMIIAKNAEAEHDRMCNLAEARRELDAALNTRARFMTVDEVLVRLKDRIMLHNGQLHDAFQTVALNAGKLHRRDVAKLLARVGMQLEEAAYEELLARLRFRPDGTMTYKDFQANFTDHVDDDANLAAHIEQSGNHRYNPIRGDERGMNVDVLERRLRDKLRENFTDLRGAFHKFDETHSGTIDRAAFRKVLDSFMCVTSEEEFDKLAARFGLANRGAHIDYRRFLEHFETRDEPGAHRWLVSVHRTGEAREAAALRAEEAHRCLVEKAYSQFRSLRDAFCSMDSRQRNFITRQELNEFLQRYQLRLAHGEPERLWQLYDVTGSGKITYTEFVNALRLAQHFAPADLGTSQHIAQRNQEDLQRHADTQQRIHQQLAENQARVGEQLSLAEVMRRLSDQLHEHYTHVFAAFRKYDTSRKGYLTIADFIRVLDDLYLYLTEQQLSDLLLLFGVPDNENRLSYVQFLNALQDRDSRFERGKRLQELVAEQRSGNTSASDSRTSSRKSSQSLASPPANLSPADVEARFRRSVQSNADALSKAFRAFDRNASGNVRLTELRRVLETFCFSLSDVQFRHLLNRARSCLIGVPAWDGDEQSVMQLAAVDLTHVQVNYNEFLSTFGKEDKRAQTEWLQELPKATANQTVSSEDVETRIHEFVLARGAVLRRAFRDADYALLGVVSKDEFLRVLRRFVMRLTDEQGSALFDRKVVPENEFGNVNYEQFLAQHGFALESLQPLHVAEAAVNQATDTADSQTPAPLNGDSERAETSDRLASAASSTMLSAERIEKQLKVALGGSSSRKWNDLQAECRSLDPANSGEVDRLAFLNALIRCCSMKVTEVEMQSVFDKYDAHSTGKFAYRAFLRNLLLSLNETAENDQQRMALRRKLQKSKIPFVSGEKSEQFFDTMLRIRARVLSEWKLMRRTFRERDPSGVGVVATVDFRNVLKQYQVVLNEEEFYHLATYFDRSMQGRIGYNEFIRAFLETA